MRCWLHVWPVVLLALSTAGCTAVLGDFEASRGAPDTGPGASDDATTEAGELGEGGPDEDADATVSEAGPATDANGSRSDASADASDRGAPADAAVEGGHPLDAALEGGGPLDAASDGGTACTPNALCQPSACLSGVMSCTGGPVCTSLTPIHEGQSCATGQVCHAGACVACDATSCPSGCCGASGCVAAADQTAAACASGGAACAACPAPAAGSGSAVCNAQVCDLACGAAFTKCAGGCWNTQTDPAHCGAGCAACSLPNTTAGCAAGVCTVAQCTSGHLDCDGLASNGCEASTQTDPAHCGGCSPCTLANASARCSAGVCGLQACNMGFTDCNGSAADGCEANLSTSGTSCGVCGHSCLGGTCSQGQCQPFVVASGTGGAGIALVDSVAYYGFENPVVLALDKSTGATIGTFPAGQNFVAFVQDSTRLYIADTYLGSPPGSSQICIVDKTTMQAVGSCLYTMVNSNPFPPTLMAIAQIGTQLWWLDSANVFWTGSTAGAAATMIETTAGSQLAADPAGLVWAESNGVLKTAPTTHLAGQSATTLASPAGAALPSFASQLLVIDGANAYWYDATDMGIYASPRSGAAFTKLATVLDAPPNLAVSGGFLYWTDAAAGTVSRVATSGGAVTAIATSQGGPSGVAVDGTAVYWINGAGSSSQFMRLAL